MTRTLLTLAFFLCSTVVGCRATIEQVPSDNEDYLEPAPGGGCPDGHLNDPWEGTDSPYFGGDQSHDVTVSIASDFRCPYCASFALMNKQLLEQSKYTSRVRFYFHHYPLESLHPGTGDIHMATAAISNQSFEQFWAVHDMIFEQRAEGYIVKLSDMEKFVTDQGLDLETYNSDMDSGKAYEIVRDDLVKGATIGINSTPSVLVCGKKLNNWGNLQDALDHYLGTGDTDTNTSD